MGRGPGVSEMASRLECRRHQAAARARWTKHTIYNLRLRLSQIQSRAVNVRSHTDEDVKDRMLSCVRSRTHPRAGRIDPE